MSPPPRPRLLWTDDDPPGRFEYEQFVIQDEGWDITWAPDVTTATRLLSEQPFDALILDQMLPPYVGLRKGDPIWGGCLVLRWLRGKAPPGNLAIDPDGPLAKNHPLPRNADLPTIIVSAFHEPKVEAAIRDASPADRNIPLIPKPLDMNAILDFLRRATSGGDPA